MSDANINLNQNQAECIKSTDHLGHTTYHNICTNATYSRQWGLGDWAAGAGLLLIGGLILGVLVLLATVVISIAKDDF